MVRASGKCFAVTTPVEALWPFAPYRSIHVIVFAPYTLHYWAIDFALHKTISSWVFVVDFDDATVGNIVLNTLRTLEKFAK